MLVVFLDACVLFPRVLRDTLLDLAQAGLYVPRWSRDIVDELRRNLVAAQGLTEAQSERLAAALQQVFPEAEVTGFQHPIPQMTNHPKDRHVVAAAVVAEARVILTTNLRDFPDADLREWSVEAWSPDTFLGSLLAAEPSRVIDVLEQQARG